MAKWPRVSFSGQHLDPTDVEHLHSDTVAAMRQYYSASNTKFSNRFVGYSASELDAELQEAIEEHERVFSMNLLSAIEAAFRIDYLQRCYARKRDELSRAMRRIHSEKGARASLEDEILQAWRDHALGAQAIVSELKGAFKYRHWLAHGRYWIPKLGRKFDYHGIYVLTQTVFDSFPFEGT